MRNFVKLAAGRRDRMRPTSVVFFATRGELDERARRAAVLHVDGGHAEGAGCRSRPACPSRWPSTTKIGRPAASITKNRPPMKMVMMAARLRRPRRRPGTTRGGRCSASPSASPRQRPTCCRATLERRAPTSWRLPSPGWSARRRRPARAGEEDAPDHRVDHHLRDPGVGGARRARSSSGQAVPRRGSRRTSRQRHRAGQLGSA